MNVHIPNMAAYQLAHYTIICGSNGIRTHLIFRVTVGRTRQASPRSIIFSLSRGSRSPGLIVPNYPLYQLSYTQLFSNSFTLLLKSKFLVRDTSCGLCENRTRVSSQTVRKDNHYPNRPILLSGVDSNHHYMSQNHVSCHQTTQQYKNKKPDQI